MRPLSNGVEIGVVANADRSKDQALAEDAWNDNDKPSLSDTSERYKPTCKL